WNATVSAWDQAVIAPDTGLLRFPLRVGDSYTASFRMESTRKGGETNARAIQGVSSTDFDYKVKVVRWEEISVPAGRFRALRIEAEGNLRRAQATGPGGNGFARTVIWYAPEVKRWVKYLYEGSLPRFAGVLAPNERMGEELVLFQPQ